MIRFRTKLRKSVVLLVHICTSFGLRTWLIILAVGCGIVGGLSAIYCVDLPQVDDLGHYRPISDTVLYDDTGRPYAFFALQHRKIAQFEEFPKVLYDAVLSIEDRNFEKHAGVDVIRMLSAACRNTFSERRAQGASTLTMQLARNLFLTPERTYTRKVKEVLLSLQIEHRLTKAQIFTFYANQIYLGEGVYGFATGAEYFFGKSVQDLSIEEAALLAALPKAPITYSPRSHPERALQRRNLVIDSMASEGKITAAQASFAKHRSLSLASHNTLNTAAPYFVEEVRQCLEKKYGSGQVHEGGLRVFTTLNLELQRTADSAVIDGIAAYEQRHSLTHSPVQGALLAIDNSSGAVKAMVGGRDFRESKFNRSTQALRQAGSSFKPYVYTAAIDRGAMPLDIVFDTPQTFITTGGRYVPHNYDEKFAGPITLERALAESRNIPALRIALQVGIHTVIDYAHRFGLTENIPGFLPTALGAADVTLMEQTSAFSTFPNDGLRAVPHYILKVTDYDGRVLEEYQPVVHDVIGLETARTMTWMLREVVLRGTAIAASRLKAPLAGKTGTTNNFTDAWFIGFSPSITCGVWVGFDEKKSLGSKETGARAALPIWMDFMAATLHGRPPNNDFRPPPDSLDRSRTKTARRVLPFVQTTPGAHGSFVGNDAAVVRPASTIDNLPVTLPRRDQ
jgi:penicillin-binding protein 1A